MHRSWALSRCKPVWPLWGFLAIVASPASGMFEVGSLNTSGASQVVVENHVAYLAAGAAGLRIVDVSRPDAPVEIGSLDVFGYASDIDVANGYAYVLDFESDRLYIVDVTQPSAPQVVATVAPPLGPSAVKVVGDRAYVTLAIESLLVIDVSNPRRPVEVASVPVFGQLDDIAIFGDLAVVAAGFHGLFFFDVGGPAAPIELAELQPRIFAVAVDVRDGVAYVTNGTSTDPSLLLIDVSNPLAPRELSRVTLPSTPRSVKVSGPIAFVSSADGLVAVDVSDAGAPTVLGSFGLAGGAGRLDISGTLAFVGTAGNSLRVIDVADPTRPAVVGRHEFAGEDVRRVALDGDRAYLADSKLGLRILDVSDPTYPVELGRLPSKGSSNGIRVEDDVAYLADGQAGLRIIDVSNPDAPVEMGVLEFPHPFLPSFTLEALDVVTMGDDAFVGLDEALVSVDVSDPTAPTLLDFVWHPGAASSLDVDTQRHLVFAAGEDQVAVYSATTPSELEVLSVVDTPDRVRDLAYDSQRLYLADGFEGLRVMDAANPAEGLVELGLLPPPEGLNQLFYEVAVDGNLACLGTATREIRIVDVTDPASMTEIGSYSNPRWTLWDIALRDGLAFLGVASAGLRTLDVGTPSAPAEIGWIDEPSWARSLLVTRDIVLLATAETGLVVLDIANHDEPTELARVRAPVHGLAAVNDLVFAIDSEGGALRLIDVSDPAEPAVVGDLQTGARPVDVAASGGLVYLAASERGLVVVDGSRPDRPTEIGALEPRAFDEDGLQSVLPARAVAATGGLVFVADGLGREVPCGPGCSGSVPKFEGGVRIVDVSVRDRPTEIGAITPEGEAFDVAARGNLVFVSVRTGVGIRGMGGYLAVFDVSTPTAPRVVGAFGGFEKPGSVRLAGRHAIVVDIGHLARFIDVSDPSAMRERLVVPGHWVVGDAEVSGGLLYVSGGGSEALRVIDAGLEPDVVRAEIRYRPRAAGRPDGRPRLGVLPVTLMGSSDLDVTEADPSSLAFGPGQASPLRRPRIRRRDVDRDGLPDMIAWFEVRGAGLSSPAEPACLTGTLWDGRRFEGCDTSRLEGCDFRRDRFSQRTRSAEGWSGSRPDRCGGADATHAAPPHDPRLSSASSGRHNGEPTPEAYRGSRTRKSPPWAP